jgi:hypothetical protein
MWGTGVASALGATHLAPQASADATQHRGGRPESGCARPCCRGTQCGVLGRDRRKRARRRRNPPPGCRIGRRFHRGLGCVGCGEASTAVLRAGDRGSTRSGGEDSLRRRPPRQRRSTRPRGWNAHCLHPSSRWPVPPVVSATMAVVIRTLPGWGLEAKEGSDLDPRQIDQRNADLKHRRPPWTVVGVDEGLAANQGLCRW